jgi:hypothetical protein
MERGSDTINWTKSEKELIVKLEQNYKNVKGDLEEQASFVYNFGDFKWERMLWLEKTRFLSHIARLQDEEIRVFYKLPSKK